MCLYYFNMVPPLGGCSLCSFQRESSCPSLLFWVLGISLLYWIKLILSWGQKRESNILEDTAWKSGTWLKMEGPLEGQAEERDSQQGQNFPAAAPSYEQAPVCDFAYRLSWPGEGFLPLEFTAQRCCLHLVVRGGACPCFSVRLKCGETVTSDIFLLWSKFSIMKFY